MFYDRLKYFQTVAEELNVTRSAEKLHLSQQALSSHIARLEEDYRTQFFERRKTGLVLTPEGRHFLAFASAVLRQEAQMAQELADMRLHYTGTVAIGVTMTRSFSLLPQFLPDFTLRYPKIKVDLHIANFRQGELEPSLVSGDLDMLIIPALSFLPSTLNCVELERDYLCLSIPRAFIETILAPGQTSAQFASLPLRAQKEQILSSGLLNRIPFVYGARYASYRARQFLSRYAPENSSVINLSKYENLFCMSYINTAAVFTQDVLVRPLVTYDGGAPSHFLYPIVMPEAPVSIMLYYPANSVNPAAGVLIRELTEHAGRVSLPPPEEFFAVLE